MTIPPFGQTTASDSVGPPAYESLESVPDNQVRLLVLCVHPRKSPTRIAKVAGSVIRTRWGESDYPGAPHTWVHMDCEGCLRSWNVPKARLRAEIDNGVRKALVGDLTDQWTRLERLKRRDP